MKCPYCGKAEMVKANKLPKGWLRCPLCRATWSKLPKPACSPLGREYDPVYQQMKGKPQRTRRSKGVK